MPPLEAYGQPQQTASRRLARHPRSDRRGLCRSQFRSLFAAGQPCSPRVAGPMSFRDVEAVRQRDRVCVMDTPESVVFGIECFLTGAGRDGAPFCTREGRLQQQKVLFWWSGNGQPRLLPESSSCKPPPSPPTAPPGAIVFWMNARAEGGGGGYRWVGGGGYRTTAAGAAVCGASEYAGDVIMMAGAGGLCWGP